MAALSPTPKQRPPFASPVKSPFFLASNDDKLERAQARAARAAAAIRRKGSTTVSDSVGTESTCLGKDQILELFQNCVKLASENKINQKNTWELNLIDHFADLVKVEEENDTETNFQKASCTLEAGVKIYSTRVDYVHSEAYKVLGGINRVGQENEQDHAGDESNINSEQEESKPQKKLSPLTTLESSFSAINVKKFDVAFAVDPLYHQTSAQFDEGGAKGLLLNNLGVFADCRVLFDSLEVPGKCGSSVAQSNCSETIDMSFAKEYTEAMVSGMLSATDISPSLSAIVNQFDKDNQRPFDVYSSQAQENLDDNVDLDGDAFPFDNDDQASVLDEGTYDQDATFSSHQDVSDLGNEPLSFQDAAENDRFENGVDDYIFSSLGFSTKQNAWAGASHWKYQKVKDSEIPGNENGSPKAKKTKKKKADPELDFLNTIDMDLSHIFAPPKNPKPLLLPTSRSPCNTRLPEDCHYQPEDLVKLFLLPNVLCLGRSTRKRTDEATEHTDGYGQTSSWDHEEGFGGDFDDGHTYTDNEELSTLVSQPRQVNKIEVQYDKTSKQVDVQALKETLWDSIQKFNVDVVEEQTPERPISFQQLLSKFPDGCRAAASTSDISPHLCFICLLHLANEHGLRIGGSSTLDDLSIHLKAQ